MQVIYYRHGLIAFGQVKDLIRWLRTLNPDQTVKEFVDTHLN